MFAVQVILNLAHVNIVTSLLKAAVCNFFWLKIIRNRYLRNYIASQCSKLSPLARFTMVSLILCFLIWVVWVSFHRKYEHGTVSLYHVCKHKVFLASLWNCVFMKHMWMKLNYIPVLNVLLITDSLRLHNIYILKQVWREHSLLFGLKECINMKFERHDN